MSNDIFSSQTIQDVLIRMKDPKIGIKLTKKVLDPKKKKKIIYSTGAAIVEWLLKDLSDKNATKTDVLQLAQIMIDRQVITKVDGRDPRRFTEEDNYSFPDEAAESLEIEVLLKNSDHKQLSAVAQVMGTGIELKEKKYRLRKFKNAFTGQEAVAWLHDNLHLEKKDDGVVLGQHLQNKGYIVNLLSKTEPFNEKAIYRFSSLVSGNGDDDGDEDIPISLSSSGGALPSYSDGSPLPSPSHAPSTPTGPPPALLNRNSNSGPLRGSPRPPPPSAPHPATTGPPPSLSGNPNEPPKRRPPPPLVNKTLSASGVANLIPRDEGSSPVPFRPPPPSRQAPPPPVSSISPSIQSPGTNHGNADLEEPPARHSSGLAQSTGMVPPPQRGRGNLRGGPGGPPRGAPPGVAPRRPPPLAVKSSPSSDDIQTLLQTPTISNNHPTVPAPSSPLKPPPARKIQSVDPGLLSNNNNSNNALLNNPPEPSRSADSPTPPPREARGSQPTISPPVQQHNNSPQNIKNNKETEELSPPVRPVRQPAPKRIIGREARGGTKIEPDPNLWVSPSGVKEEEHIIIKKQLIASEQTFVASSTTSLQIYLENNPAIVGIEKEMLFANIDDIIAAHQNVLAGITQTDSAGEILQQLTNHLTLYLTYCANLPNAFSVLSKLRERGSFVEVIMEDSFDIQTIEALLEIPRVHLDDYSAQIKDFIERTNPENEASEIKKLTLALQKFEQVQQQVRKRDLVPKHLVRLWDIEHSFSMSEGINLEERELIYEATVRLLKDNKGAVDGKNNNLRIYLFNGLIICSLPVNGYTQRSLINGPPVSMFVRDVLPSECANGLEFTSKDGRSLLVSLPTIELKRKWMSILPVQYQDDRRPILKMEY